MEMNDEERLHIAVLYLLMGISGNAVWLFVWLGMLSAAYYVGLLVAVVGTGGFVWTCWGTGLLGSLHAHLSRRRPMSAPPRSAQDRSTPGADDVAEWLVVSVPCKPEIYEEMTRAIAEGWRLTQVPGHADTVSAAEDPRVTVDGPHGYRTTLEKPRLL